MEYLLGKSQKYKNRTALPPDTMRAELFPLSQQPGQWPVAICLPWEPGPSVVWHLRCGLCPVPPAQCVPHIYVWLLVSCDLKIWATKDRAEICYENSRVGPAVRELGNSWARAGATSSGPGEINGGGEHRPGGASGLESSAQVSSIFSFMNIRGRNLQIIERKQHTVT